MVVILATPNARVFVRLRLTQSCYVNVQAVAYVDPPRIDNIHTVAALALEEPRIDIEEVVARNAVGLVDIMVGGHVEIIRHVREGPNGDLSVNVRVPRKHLAVPPPTQQCAMRYPSFEAVVFTEAEVRANHVVEAVASLIVSYDAAEISAIIVAVDVGGSACNKVS